jgi:hypothetical protein
MTGPRCWALHPLGRCELVDPHWGEHRLTVTWPDSESVTLSGQPAVALASPIADALLIEPEEES